MTCRPKEAFRRKHRAWVERQWMDDEVKRLRYVAFKVGRTTGMSESAEFLRRICGISRHQLNTLLRAGMVGRVGDRYFPAAWVPREDRTWNAP